MTRKLARYAFALAIAALASTQLAPSDGAMAHRSPETHALASHAPTQVAHKSGKWVQLSSGSAISTIDEPDALGLRTGGIEVVWRQEDTTSKQSIRSRTVKESGRVGSPVSTVVQGWANVIDDPRIINYGNKMLVAFGGQRSTQSGEVYDGAMAYATSTNGTAWAQGPGSLTQTQSAYGSYGTGAVDDDGTPVVGVNASSTTFVTVHRGIDPSVPAATPDWTTKSTTFGCCAYAARLGIDDKSGKIWATWYSNASANKHNGVLAEQVYPKPLGKVFQAPGSSIKGSSLDPGQGVSIATRKGGGVYIAYKVGYPTANKIRVWEAGTRHQFTVHAPNTARITLETGPGGRLWLAWFDSVKSVIHVARTNQNATGLGAVRSIALPSKRLGTYVWSMAGSGATGPLHLVINSQAGIGKPQIWYQKVSPGLTLVATPRTLNKGVVTAKVSDAGQAVAGAKVTFAGATKQTNTNGIAKFRVTPSTPSRRYAMRASKAGYAAGAASVKVT